MNIKSWISGALIVMGGGHVERLSVDRQSCNAYTSSARG